MHEEAMIDAQEKSKDVNEMNASSKKSLLKRVKALSQSLSVCLIVSAGNLSQEDKVRLASSSGFSAAQGSYGRLRPCIAVSSSSPGRH